jgi:hypothetical protein
VRRPWELEIVKACDCKRADARSAYAKRTDRERSISKRETVPKQLEALKKKIRRPGYSSYDLSLKVRNQEFKKPSSTEAAGPAEPELGPEVTEFRTRS